MSCLRAVFVVSALLVCRFAVGQGNSLPPQLAATIQQAQSLLGQQKPAEAERILQDATNQFSKTPTVWYLLGYSRHAQKKYDAALRAYQKANQLAQGKAPNTLYNMACIYALQNNRDKAFDQLAAAVKAGFTNLSQIHSDPELASLRGDPRLEKYKVKWLSDADLFAEPSRIIRKWVGEAAGDQFGWTARRAGDIDKDGAIDFVATAPTHKQGAGKVYVYSSRSGKLLHSVEGQPGDRLGNSAVGIGDVNGDRIPDWIAGAPNANGHGAAIVYSGRDAKVIHRLEGKTAGGQFGYEVSEAGDLDGDNVPDFVVGEMAGTGRTARAGRVVAYSGKSAAKLFELSGEKAGDGFGNAVAVASKDGMYLLAVGAQNAGPSNRGRVAVFKGTVSHRASPATPQPLFTIEGNEHSVNLGQMFLSFPGDLNGDGILDVYASDFSDKSQIRGGGRIMVHSGADGKQLLSIKGTVAGEGLGTSPSDAGDVDGDGIGDLIVGAWQNNRGAPSGGRVYLYSSANGGRLIRTWTSRQAGDTLGFDACGIGDVDGDGNIDFLLTSAWSNQRGPKTGRVFILAGDNFRHSKQPQRTP